MNQKSETKDWIAEYVERILKDIFGTEDTEQVKLARDVLSSRIRRLYDEKEKLADESESLKGDLHKHRMAGSMTGIENTRLREVLEQIGAASPATVASTNSHGELSGTRECFKCKCMIDKARAAIG